MWTILVKKQLKRLIKASGMQLMIADLVRKFPGIMALGIHDPEVHGSFRAPQAIGPLPQLHRSSIVLLVVLVVPAQGVDGCHKVLREISRKLSIT